MELTSFVVGMTLRHELNLKQGPGNDVPSGHKLSSDVYISDMNEVGHCAPGNNEMATVKMLENRKKVNKTGFKPLQRQRRVTLARTATQAMASR